MNAQRFVTFVLLISLPTGSGVILAAEGAASASPSRRVEAVQVAPSQTANVRANPLTSTGWWAAVQQDIHRSEYLITWQEQTHLQEMPSAYQAPNRAHNLRTYFTPEGIHVIPRTTDLGLPTADLGLAGNPKSKIENPQSWEWGLRLIGYGYPGRLQAIVPAEIVAQANRIEYRRSELTEWYVNSERGLEQGFTVFRSPITDHRPGTTLGRAVGRPPSALVLHLAVVGSLTPSVTGDGKAIEFTTSYGVRVLRYSELHAYDAAGRELSARMELPSPGGRPWPPQRSGVGEVGGEGEILRLTVDVRGAAYPITIDPLATTPNWTAESDQASAQFGYSVGTAGDVNADGYSDVIVGAPWYDNGQTDEGRAFVYHGSATGLSTAANWTAEGDQASANYGYSVATAGDVNGDGFSDVIVGAYRYDNEQTDEGRAFVYHGSAAGLSTSANWTAESNQASTNYGSSVGTAGDVNGDGFSDALVGAPLYNNGQTDEGRAFVYHGSGAGLSTTANWTAESDQASAQFSYSVGTAGDVNGDGFSDALVGSPYYDNGQTDEGRAFVYHGSAAGLSTAANWTAESDQDGATFGWSVGTTGDVNGDGYAEVIVGAPAYDNGQTDEGRAFVYHGSAAGLSTTANWTAESEQASANYGWSVSTAGDVNGDGYAEVIAGATQYDGGQTNEGRAFVYHGSAAGLSTAANWTAESDQTDAYYGSSASTAGDVNGDGFSDAIVGAYRFDNVQTDEGRALVYHGSAAGLSTGANWTSEGNQTDANFGWSVSTAGDVNGDGYADVNVGAILYDGGQGDEGRAFVYHGSPVGLSTTASWTAESDQASAGFGYSVATAGDVNGDGYSDVIVGAPFFDNIQIDEGRAFVFYGSPGGLSTAANWTAEGEQDGANYGYSVAGAGDVNGDGYGDTIVGAWLYDSGQLEEGRAFVYHGSAAGLSTTENWTAESNQDLASFGSAVATAGDVNADGYSDVIVGALFYDNAQGNEGRAFVYHGSASGLSTVADWTAESDQSAAQFGFSVGTAGDVNGDAFSDAIIGAPFFDGGQVDEGRAFVYHGSAVGLSPAANWTAESDQSNGWFGYAVSTAGDVNGDGHAEVIVGAPPYDGGQANEGRAFVYHGAAAGLSAIANWTAESNQDGANFGWSVAGAGDVNGDGYAEVIVGSYTSDNGQVDEGRAFVYHGNSAAGMSLNPRQRRSDDSAPIAPLGTSDSASAFRLALLGRTPFGRSQVRLEWEVKPLGALFDGAGTQQSSSWLDTGTAGAALNELVSGLTANTAHHWRVRLRYHPASTPFQQNSRWLTIPWNGWNEQDLRTGDDLIFADGFESGDLSAWASARTDGGDLSVSTAAALDGSFGLEALMDDTQRLFVTDDNPSAEPRYRVRFYFDPNSIVMANGDLHDIFHGYQGTGTPVVRVQFRFAAGNYQIRAGLRNDSNAWTNTPWFGLSDTVHFVEIDWRGATVPGANDGGLTLWTDDVQRADLAGVDNDTRQVDRVRMGAVAGLDPGTSGTYYFDTFESRMQSYIGP